MPKPLSVRILKSATALALATLSSFAMADDPPGRVGRVALAQGQVSIGGEVGAEMSPAQVNWPITTGSMVYTAAGARTELRVGSTSIRLDGDSSLEVLALDDDTLRLRLHYGSASVRILNPEVLRGFELLTPQARVHLQQPGRVRVDAERVRDTSVINVFDGAAVVEAGGSQLTVRAGKRADVTDDDVRTASAVQDAFDGWAAARDRAQDNAVSTRYVTTEMTGYEDLDRYGSWRVDTEYGPLWTPAVSTAWVPYRDGSWTWIEPWGWTWVDNAPWGYAPFHYGRWVYVNRRWAWAPGRHERPVWAPALVGWVGGAGWNITFRDRSQRPAYGWYPLSPHDRYVPSYRASEEHLRWLNLHVRPDPHRGHDYRPQGLTVLPQDRFGPGGRVNVPRAPIATVPPVLVHNGQNLGAPATGAPPAPPGRPHRGTPIDRDGDGRPDRPLPLALDRDRDGRPDRLETRFDRNGDGRPDRPLPPALDRDRDGRPDRMERLERLDTGRVERDGFVRPRQLQPRQMQPQQLGAQQLSAQQLSAQQFNTQQPAPGTLPPASPANALPVTSPTPHQPPQALPITSPTPRPAPTPQPLTSSNPVVQPFAVPPGGQARPGQDRREFDERRREFEERRGEWENRQRERGGEAPQREHRAPPVSMAAPAAPAPAPAARPMPAMPAPQMSAPQPQPRPAPAAMPAPQMSPSQPQPQPRPAPKAEEHRGRGEERGRNSDR